MYTTFWAGLVSVSLPGITEILEESIHGARVLRMPASSLPPFPFVQHSRRSSRVISQVAAAHIPYL